MRLMHRAGLATPAIQYIPMVLNLGGAQPQGAWINFQLRALQHGKF